MKSKSKDSTLTIFNFPYFINENGSFDKRFFGIYIVRALLACLLSVSGILCISIFTTRSADVTAAVCSAVSCLTFFILLSCIKTRYVVIISAVLAGWAFHSFYSSICSSAVIFYDSVVTIASKNSVYFGTSAMEKAFDFVILIGMVFGAVCGACSVRRFKWYFPAAIVAIAAAPAILGNELHFSLPMLIFVAALLGMRTAASCEAARVRLSAGTLPDMFREDKFFRRENKRLKGISKIKSETRYFGRYVPQSVITTTVIILCGAIASSAFPRGGSLKFDEVIRWFTELGGNISDWMYDTFNVSFGGSDYGGFFSADGGKLNISGSISHDDDENSDETVAEIYTSTGDKMYLRGDVGYDFDGNNWKSISSLDYKNIKYEMEYTYDREVDMDTVLSAYTPEIQYYLMYKASADGYYYDNLKYILPRTVKVNYLRRINTLLMGGTPYILTFRENKYFNVYGDFTAVADKGSVKSMETAVLYQDDLEKVRLAQLAAQTDSYKNIQTYWDSSIPTSIYDYQRYVPIYRQFVYDYYTSVPQEEKECIDDFIGEFLEYAGYNSEGSYDQSILCGSFSANDMGQIAADMEKYLASGMNYTYSLTADNFSEGSYVNNFLTKTKEGHCAMFATVMCLAMREMGLPARYVTGFTVGGKAQQGDENNPFKYSLTKKDLHAWVEVYFDGLGWIAYDPTPPDGRPASDHLSYVTEPSETLPPEDETTTPSETTSITAEDTTTSVTTTTTATSSGSQTSAATTPTGENSSEPGGNENETAIDPQAIKLILIIAGALLLIFVIFMSVRGAFKLLSKKEKQQMKFFKSGEPQRAVSDMLGFTLTLLKTQGAVQRNGETPSEFAARADKMLKRSVSFSEMIPLFEKAEFDKEPVFDEEERGAAYAFVSALYREISGDMKLMQRLRLRIKLFGKTKNERKAKNDGKGIF